MTTPLHLPSQSLAAGAALQCYEWAPVGAQRAVVVLAHGYAEHAGRYEYLAGKLSERGIGVYALDHWGHGKSDGERGFVPGFSVYTDGLDALRARIKERNSDVPFFLIGHSMGGLIASAHLIDSQTHYAGAILSGPAIKAAVEPSRLTMWISRLLSVLAPRLGVHALDAGQVSRDPAVVDAYLADPLNHTGKMSARLAVEMFDAMATTRAKASQITLPMLLLHGDADGLTAPDGSRFLFETVASQDKQLKLYPGLYHEIFNEPERDEVIADVIGWIEERLS